MQARRPCLLPIELLSASVVISLLVTSPGCRRGDRPPIGRVSGVVTVDGEPVAGLAILFSQKGFRSSSGLTDQDGRYELNYLSGVKGSAVGKHRVRIQYVSEEGASRPRRLPARYNLKSQLFRDVEPGSNEFNFELETRE